ncbi:hypothetical protein, variant [Exophiala xenobiotica]|uniref:Uncharacterized protein n=1 Tax=Exophiala xenobiotica TaxID=348802 RepID=A0A0D2EQC4_9EURO|nr:hypothetical protein, variant [Exophiala xenobiotica]XP_013318457.1 uncharacterized protein PV05_02429 [Exophiala xenobiotica]KIW57872.1 hypothetical protein PV05_02429 [Exophiala xenobiotica]KIW57873.1 hypothetical protein, variant [Exophiala xenobiotica]
MSDVFRTTQYKAFNDELVRRVDEARTISSHFTSITDTAKNTLKVIFEQKLYEKFFVYTTQSFIDVFLSPTPPTLADLLRLPAVSLFDRDVLDCSYVVYIVVLIKDGVVSFRLYVGSASDTSYGAWRRLQDYETGKQMAMHVQESLDQGFEIHHHGIALLASRKHTDATGNLRSWILALEAVVTYSLWTQWQGPKSRPHQDHYMRPLCRWDVDNLGYLGLNTQNPLGEPVSRGDDGLSASARSYRKTKHALDQYEAGELSSSDETVQNALRLRQDRRNRQGKKKDVLKKYDAGELSSSDEVVQDAVKIRQYHRDRDGNRKDVLKKYDAGELSSSDEAVQGPLKRRNQKIKRDRDTQNLLRQWQTGALKEPTPDEMVRIDGAIRNRKSSRARWDKLKEDNVVEKAKANMEKWGMKMYEKKIRKQARDFYRRGGWSPSERPAKVDEAIREFRQLGHIEYAKLHAARQYKMKGEGSEMVARTASSANTKDVQDIQDDRVLSEDDDIGDDIEFEDEHVFTEDVDPDDDMEFEHDIVSANKAYNDHRMEIPDSENDDVLNEDDGADDGLEPEDNIVFSDELYREHRMEIPDSEDSDSDWNGKD